LLKIDHILIDHNGEIDKHSLHLEKIILLLDHLEEDSEPEDSDVEDLDKEDLDNHGKMMDNHNNLVEEDLEEDSEDHSDVDLEEDSDVDLVEEDLEEEEDGVREMIKIK
jgi:hypothetical protein